ncbi:hypothetical protein A3K73_08205 [Candidatus Pacearchaeota archaeon RBG_13_36_9]|nr:MAG: hypothetical protein A3K73_08205 [Candidatus Pacearchaeota archaeon RBG_13_36_9]
MVLELAQGRSEINLKDSCFPNLFLRTLLESSETPEILEAKLTGNNMLLTTKSCPGGFNGAAFKGAGWVHYSLSSKRGDFPQITFSLDPNNRYTFEFSGGKNFHKTVDGIFNPAGRYKGDKTRDVGLELPSELDVAISYDTPAAFWRGLPKPFVKNIKDFRFNGKYFTISWPRKIAISNLSPTEKKEELGVGVNDYVSERERGFQILKDRVMGARTGKVKYIEETSGRTDKESRFEIDPSLMNYEFMQELEEIARAEPPGIAITSCHWGLTSIVAINGKLENTDFRDVAKQFDDFVGYEVAKVKGGNISVRHNKRNSNNPISIVYENATLEDAERLVATRQVYTSDVWITPLTKFGDKVHFSNSGKTCVA